MDKNICFKEFCIKIQINKNILLCLEKTFKTTSSVFVDGHTTAGLIEIKLLAIFSSVRKDFF